MYRSIKKIAVLIFLLSLEIGIFAGDFEPIVFDFSNPDCMKGWSKTGTLDVQQKSKYLCLTGKGGDAKIYRGIRLPQGEYQISADGRGESVEVVVSKGWGAPFFIMRVSSGNFEAWRREKKGITIPEDGAYLLIVYCNKGKNGELRDITIESVSGEREQAIFPATEVLAANRPNPEIVRGFTLQSENFIREAADEWHANVARKWMRMRTDDSDDAFKRKLNDVTRFLETARQNKLKVILTYDIGVVASSAKHASFAFWSNPELPKTFAAHWKKTAAALLPYRDVIYAYDLGNEPLDWDQMPEPPKQWRAVAIAAMEAIREVDKDTWMMYEPGPGGLHDGFKDMLPLPDAKVIYSVHYYSPHPFTHQGIKDITGTDLKEVQAKTGVRCTLTKNDFKKHLQIVRDFQLNYKVPILVGEFSVVRWAPKIDAENYLRNLVEIFEEYGWSWCYHGLADYNGWSLVHSEDYFDKNVSKTETERARIIKSNLNKNLLNDNTR